MCVLFFYNSAVITRYVLTLFNSLAHNAKDYRAGSSDSACNGGKKLSLWCCNNYLTLSDLITILFCLFCIAK